ncbi:carboxypeptidase-like regulatory domain-containing protein [Flavobacterium sp. PS2]|uniref:Kelch repeat-containing protein n=1 Tax=Flavobacterium sp. PS2 TaxID=3384157 RepID=UPI00390C564E
MKKLILIFVFFPTLLIAQNIKGNVISQKDNLPVENTNVFALSSKVGTITDENGEFYLKVFPEFKEDETLQFSHIGYITKNVSLSYLAKNNYKVFLEEEAQNLSGVTIVANTKLKTKLAFTEITNLKHPVFSFGSFLKDDKIYISGGDAYPEIDHMAKMRAKIADPTFQDFFNEGITTTKRHYKKYLSIYNIKTNSWEFPDLKLQVRAYHNIHFYNNLIYILGGKKMFVNKISSWEYLQDQIEVLDFEKLTIKVDKTNPHQAADFASFTYKDNIIVMGGSIKATESGVKDFSNKVHLYNITSGYWYELTSMPTAEETTGILIDDKIYLIGGNNGKPISKIETFDLVTEKWLTEGELFSGLERPAITYNDDIIYFFEDEKMYTYNFKLKVLKEYEINLPLKYSAMYYNNNKLYILGGRIDNSYSKIPSAKIFSIDLDEFKLTNPNKIKNLSQETTLAKIQG